MNRHEKRASVPGKLDLRGNIFGICGWVHGSLSDACNLLPADDFQQFKRFLAVCLETWEPTTQVFGYSGSAEYDQAVRDLVKATLLEMTTWEASQ